MKKFLYIFLISILFSCCSDPNNSTKKIISANNDMEIELVYNNELGADKIGHQNNPPFNRIYKFKFEGHRYIDFDGYRRTGVVHDPNCECFK